MAEKPSKFGITRLRSVLGFGEDMNMVAPFLWNREHDRNGINDQIVKCATAETSCYRIVEDSLDHIPDLLVNSVNLLKQNIGCDDAFVYLVDKVHHEVVRMQNPSDGLPKVSFPIRPGKSVAGHVAFETEFVMSNDLKRDPRFRFDDDKDDKEAIRSALCVPVLVHNLACYAVIEFLRYNSQPFVPRDLETMTVVSGWMGSTIEQHQRRLKIKRSEDTDCRVNNILQSLISLQADFDQSLYKLLEVAKDAVGAENASFYMFVDPIVPCAEYMFTYDPPIDAGDKLIVMKKRRSKIDGLVKQTIDTGKCINILDFATDNRVDPRLDSKQFITLRSCFFVPILDLSGCPLGVVQMINKSEADGVFRFHDEGTLHSFRACLVNMLKFQLQLDLQSKAVGHNELCEDVLLHRIPMHIVLTPTVPPTIADSIVWPENFSNFEWYPNDQLNEHQMIDLCYKMLVTVCNDKLFEPNTMFIFMITVKEMHRPHPFHNFQKSFASVHGVFCILSRIGDKFDDIERLSMMLGSLCVGFDHSGLTNAFLRLSKNPLSKIYTESYNQNHIVWMAKLIIDNTRVLHLLSTAQQDAFMEQFREQILYTDVHAFTLRRCLVEDWFRERSMDWTSVEDRRMVRNLITMCTYLPMLYKPFRLSKRLIGYYIQQMWAEGDMLHRLGVTPIPHYNRNTNLTPQINLNILRKIGVACFRAIRTFLPETLEMYTTCTNVILAWEQMLEHHGKVTWIPDKSIYG